MKDDEEEFIAAHSKFNNRIVHTMIKADSYERIETINVIFTVLQKRFVAKG